MTGLPSATRAAGLRLHGGFFPSRVSLPSNLAASWYCTEYYVLCTVTVQYHSTLQYVLRTEYPSLCLHNPSDAWQPTAVAAQQPPSGHRLVSPANPFGFFATTTVYVCLPRWPADLSVSQYCPEAHLHLRPSDTTDPVKLGDDPLDTPRARANIANSAQVDCAVLYWEIPRCFYSQVSNEPEPAATRADDLQELHTIVLGL